MHACVSNGVDRGVAIIEGTEAAASVKNSGSAGLYLASYKAYTKKFQLTACYGFVHLNTCNS